jgi:transcriptional regulator with XRE-family HTH domain
MRLRVKEIRIDKGWTQDHLAGLAGISTSFLSQIESGKREPGPDTLLSLSNALGVPIGILVISDVGIDVNDIIRDLAELSPKQRDAVRNLIRSFRDS